MDNTIIPEQAEESGDASAALEVGHTVNVIPQEDAGTAETAKEDKNKDAKDWRKSDKEWQQMAEAAKKGESAATILENLSKALGVDKNGKTEEKVDVVQEISKKVDDLQTKLAISEFEKSHPAVASADNREAWAEIVSKKGHLVKSGELTYDDLWAIIRKGSKPSTSNRDFKDQELSIGSIPAPSKTIVSGTEVDPDVYTVMKKAGYSDEQIRLSA